MQDRESYRNRNSQTVDATWTTRESYLLAAICLLAGIALGYLFHGSQSPSASSPATNSGAVSAPAAVGQQQMPTAEMVDKMAAPFLERVKSNPKDLEAYVQLGNLYMDHGQYAPAIQYYDKAVELDPRNVNVRTDLGTCYFYAGDPKRAIAEFQKSLQLNPTHAQTLFNMGVVEQQGMKDNKAAVAAWEKLLATNPGYEQRDKVQQMIAQARQQ